MATEAPQDIDLETATDRECVEGYTMAVSNTSLVECWASHIRHGRRVYLDPDEYRKRATKASITATLTRPSDVAMSATSFAILNLCFRESHWLEEDDVDRDGINAAARIKPLQPSPRLGGGEGLLPHAAALNGRGFDGKPLGKIYAWRSPKFLPGPPLRALDKVAKLYEDQYNSLNPSRQLGVEYCVNVVPQELTASLRKIRDVAKKTKVLFHYNGHGVSRPRNGHLFLPNNDPDTNDGADVKYEIGWIRRNLDFPMIFVADCNNAGTILRAFEHIQKTEDRQAQGRGLRSAAGPVAGSQMYGSHMDLSGGDPQQQQQQQYGSPIGMGSPFNSINMGGMGPGDELRKQPQQRKIRDDFYFIGACEEGQLLPSHALLPNDILTACLTSPLKMSLLWFVITSRTIAVADIHPLLIHCLPGAFANKASPLGLLKWAFDSYMDSLARTVLSANDFSVLMRADPFLAGLYRGYFLAHYIISQLGGRVPVHPPIEDSSRNPIWQSWEWTLERTVAALHRTLRPLPSFGLSSPELREYLDPTNVTTLLSVAHRGRTIVNYVELAQSQQANIMTLLGSTPMVEEGVSIGATLDRLRCDVLDLRPLEALGKLPFVIGWLQTLAYRDQGMRLLTRFLDLGETAVFEVALMDSFNRLLSRLIIHPQCTRLQPSFLFCFAKAVFADSTIVDDAARKLILPVAVKHLTNTTDIDEQSESAWQIPTLRAFASPAGQTTIASSLLLALILVPGSTFQIEREILKEGGFRGVCNALASIPAPVTPVTGASTAARKHSTTLYGVDALPSPGTTPPVTMGTPFTTFNGGVVGGVRTVHISVFYQKWITHEEAVDCVVQLRLSLMALFSSLLVHVNLHCGEEGVRMSQDQFSMRMDEFQQLMERLIDPLRLFLYESWPSVRLAATRTIGVVLAHGLLSEILQLRLLRIFLDRLHEELDPEIRLEQLGVLSTIMARCSPIVTTQAFQRIIGQSTAHRRRTIDFSLNGPWSTLHMQSLSVRSESVIHFQQDGIMSPFMLPAPDPEASGTLASSVAQHPHRRSKVHTVASTIDVTRGGAAGGQPSSKRGQGGAEPFFLSGVASRPFVPRGRVPYAENRRDESTLEECHGRSLLFLLAALQSDFGLLRLHAERILDSLADAGVLLRRRDMTSALPTSSNSLSSFTQPTMMSSESVTQGIGTSMKWKLKFWVDKKATTAKAAAGNASSSAAHFQEDSSYHYDSGNDQGVGGQVDDTVRCLSIQPLSSSSPSSSPAQVSQEGGIQRSGVNMFVESNLQFLRHFAIPVILFLDQPCLTPTDDQDAHHAFSQAARADLAAFNEQASQLLRSHHDRDKTTFHDIACGQNFGPVSALAFHPTQHVLAVASGHTVHFVQLRNPESNDAFKSDVLRTSIVLPQVNRLFRKEECYRRLHSRSEYDSLNLLTNGEFEFYDDDNGGSRALYADVDVRSRAGTTEPGTTPRSIGGTLLNNNNNNDALPLPATMNSPINNLHMVDAAGSTPLLICVYGNGVVKICSDVLEQSRLKRAKEPFVLRVNSFDTAPIDGRATFQYCTSSYHGAAQHLRVTTVDGGVATWDLSVEQLVCHIGGASNGSFASCVFSHPTDPFRYGMGNKSILLFDTRSPTPSHTLQYGYEPNCLKGVWSGRYNSIVGGAFDRDGAVVFWDERKAGTPLLTRHTGSTKGTLKAARLAEIHPYQRNLMSVTVTGNDVLSQALSAKPYEKAHVGVSCIAYHPLDSLCAMGLSNGKVVLRIRKKTIVVAPEVLNMGAV